jgi:phage FluMu protein Com
MIKEYKCPNCKFVLAFTDETHYVFIICPICHDAIGLDDNNAIGV